LHYVVVGPGGHVAITGTATVLEHADLSGYPPLGARVQSPYVALFDPEGNLAFLGETPEGSLSLVDVRPDGHLLLLSSATAADGGTSMALTEHAPSGSQ
jgi:hypothetical protein